MCILRLLRAAIGTLGLVLFTTPVALAAGPADRAAGRAVASAPITALLPQVQ